MGVGEATQSALKDTRVFASRPCHMYLKARGRKDKIMFSREFQGSQLIQVVLVFPQIFYPINKLDGNVEDPAAEKRVIT